MQFEKENLSTDFSTESTIHGVFRSVLDHPQREFVEFPGGFQMFAKKAFSHPLISEGKFNEGVFTWVLSTAKKAAGEKKNRFLNFVSNNPNELADVYNSCKDGGYQLAASTKIYARDLDTVEDEVLKGRVVPAEHWRQVEKFTAMDGGSPFYSERITPYLYVINEREVGKFSYVDAGKDSAYLTRIFVPEEYRKNGFAKKMIEWAHLIAFRQRKKRFLIIPNDLSMKIGLMEKTGHTPVCNQDVYYRRENVH